MSSYFDTAARLFADAVARSDEAEAERIVGTVLRRYRGFLSLMENRMLLADVEKYGLMRKISEANIMPTIRSEDRVLGTSKLIEFLHDKAHEIANMRIKTRDGTRILDNPYQDGKSDFVQEATLR